MVSINLGLAILKWRNFSIAQLVVGRNEVTIPRFLIK